MRRAIQNGQRIFGISLCVNNRARYSSVAGLCYSGFHFILSFVGYLFATRLWFLLKKNIYKRIYERLNWAELSFAHINILHNAALIHIKSVGAVSVRRCMCSMFHTKLMLPMKTHGPRFLNCFSSATFYKFILKKYSSHPYYFLIILIQRFFFHYFQALKFTHGSKPN